ncbi:type II toxin-antitoxin system CcdA family antitoxin [Salmonella enterica]
MSDKPRNADEAKRWKEENREGIQALNRFLEKNGSLSDSVARWKAENADAIEAMNKIGEETGSFSDEYRRF